jgi:hypothetical protein
MKFTVPFVLSLLMLAPTAALAYIPSPQYGAFELKFGPYKPSVDKTKSLTGTPYKDTFGDKSMFLTVLELDWQIWHPPGLSLGIGGSFGFMQAYTKSAILTEDGEESDQESADYTVLNVMPFALLAVIRIDVLANKLSVPLVPYLKVGINWYLWWILGGGEVAEFSDQENGTVKGRGGTLGWQISPGLAFRLDSLDPISARTFDNEVGVNHSYLFMEIIWADVDGFDGGEEYLNLSSDNFGGATFLGGLCVEF